VIRPSRTVLGLLGWVVAAAAAITAGIFAVGAIGSGISGNSTSPLSNQAVAKALAQTTAGSSAARSSPPVRSTGPRPARSSPASRTAPTAPRSSDRPPSRSGPVRSGNTRVLSVRGGSIVANCTNGQATLQSWSPAQGYATDSIQRGPQAVARITFKSSAAEVKVEVSCPAGVPTAQQDLDDDDDGGGDRHGGSGSGGSGRGGGDH
jgi:hypothetical protein